MQLRGEKQVKLLEFLDCFEKNKGFKILGFQCTCAGELVTKPFNFSNETQHYYVKELFHSRHIFSKAKVNTCSTAELFNAMFVTMKDHF